MSDPQVTCIEVGASTHRAQRDVNEDHAAAALLAGGAYVVVADGVGGEAWGEVASAAAVTCATHSLRSQLELPGGKAAAPDCATVVRRAFEDAQRGLATLAERRALAFGLKTTLIIALVRGNSLAVGHIGDGGLWTWRPGDETPRALLQPMANAAGELSAVLSPWVKHEPRIEVHPWSADGVILAASDGISDPLPLSSIDIVVRELHASASPVQQLLEQLLEACHAQSDANGPIFMDNMAVAALRQGGA